MSKVSIEDYIEEWFDSAGDPDWDQDLNLRDQVHNDLVLSLSQGYFEINLSTIQIKKITDYIVTWIENDEILPFPNEVHSWVNLNL